ncbi:hypothetical protein RJ641_027518 [Dillenia turbinata]|uniref:DNA-binding protein RHL1 n=1 Tax=Dillenia turbinata TaxID=194707 RepID=A0AAN8W5J3_9MAGN
MGMKNGNNSEGRSSNPEMAERKRLKRRALSNKLLSESPPSCPSTLAPSKLVLKHHGKDVLKKSQRKNRFLFSFPGLLAPVNGGKIGELKDLGTKNPILYLHFPQGQMKLFGTIVYPKNTYLTLQFSRGGKNVMCEDNFDAMIVFSDAWWIGTKEENPEEIRLEFPKELTEGQPVECDFKGGAGAASEKRHYNDSEAIFTAPPSPKVEQEDDTSESEDDLNNQTKATPVRHSERTAGKSFNFEEPSSNDDIDETDDADMAGEEKQISTKKSFLGILDVDKEDAAVRTPTSKSSRKRAITENCSNHDPLVQPTISALFKKAEEKTESDDIEEFSSTSQDTNGSDEDWAA